MVQARLGGKIVTISGFNAVVYAVPEESFDNAVQELRDVGMDVQVHMPEQGLERYIEARALFPEECLDISVFMQFYIDAKVMEVEFLTTPGTRDKVEVIAETLGYTKGEGRGSYSIVTN